jgi:hypothetical protein
MSVANTIATVVCVVLGATGLYLSAHYRVRMPKSPLTEAMFGASMGQLWLGSASYDLDVHHIGRLALVSAFIALAQFRIWAAMRERSGAGVNAN